MTQPVSRFVNQSPVPRFAVGPTKAREPHLAVVYATASGEVVCVDGRPLTPGQQVFSRYRTRYEVDMRPQHRSAVLRNNPLVSRDGVHAFEVTLSFTFRVDGWTGAEEFVRAGLTDPLPLVHGHLISLFHGAGQLFSIEDSFGLQRHLNQLCAAPAHLPQGLVVDGCRASVRPDTKALAFLESLIDADWKERQDAAAHMPAVGGAHRGGQLDAIKQGYEIESTKRQADSFAGMLTNSEGLIRHYLVTHPGDAAGAFEMSRQLESARMATAELQNQRALGLFQVMAEKGLIVAGDLDLLRQQLTGQVGMATGGHVPLSATAPTALPGARPWDAPAAAPAQLTAGAPQQAPAPAPAHQQTAPGQPQPGQTVPGQPQVYEPTLVVPVQPHTAAAPAAFSGAALIYLVLDESLDRGSVDELNRGLASLHSALSGAPGVSAALRLCVLGMAAATELRLPLDTVLPSTRTPILTGRPGLSYTHAFRTLQALLRQDVALVKTQRTQVLRPIVFFLTGGVPDEGTGWRTAYAELVDQDGSSVAPHLIALGLGGAEASTVRTLATRPEFGFMAAPHQDAASAAHSVAAFLRDTIVGYGQRLGAGDPQFALAAPDGFRSAEDAL
ncbi:vWA domain-containing protein [Streptomyces sp. B21-083]|uniref:vWA domain-containing protein n=1 Tax=Streptomyces sp. B21-083 TaxID=3039410 RepID=UPI002FEF8387